MPKKSVLMTDCEAAICARAVEVRMELRFTQEEIARALQIPRNQWCGIEYGRNPLRYWVGDSLCSMFGISERWVATGQLPMRPYFDIADKVGVHINPGSLFSKVYDSVLEQHVEAGFLEIEKFLGPDAVKSGGVVDAPTCELPLAGRPPEKALAYYIQRFISNNLARLPEPFASQYAAALFRAESSFRRKHREEIERRLRENQISIWRKPGAAE